MSYYYNKTVSGDFEKVIENVTLALKGQGFGVLTEIDFSGTMKKKLDVDMPKYRILGACNPGFAYQAYQKENKIGVMLPCNVIVQEVNGAIEVSAVDPVASMQGVGNADLEKIASEVKNKLKAAINAL
ncbi:MAG: DUF302 domain-containing protein [Cyclobacteriaceae bacterium]|nr:DUF302 domain-containing protein [Cyclobacteriaceae bacterium]